MSADAVHEVTQDGRDRHWMERDGNFWVCECGETRDAFMRPVSRPVQLQPSQEATP